MPPLEYPLIGGWCASLCPKHLESKQSAGVLEVLTWYGYHERTYPVGKTSKYSEKTSFQRLVLSHLGLRLNLNPWSLNDKLLLLSKNKQKSLPLGRLFCFWISMRTKWRYVKFRKKHTRLISPPSDRARVYGEIAKTRSILIRQLKMSFHV